MLKIYTRSLHEKENKKINSIILKTQKIINKFKLCIPAFFIFLSLLFVSIYFLGNGWYDRPLGIFLGVLFIFSIIIIWALFSNIKDFKKNILELKGIIEDNKVKVIRCKTNKFIEFQEYKDFGVNLFFQVEKNKILYLGGQDFYPTKSFPNTDFEIAYHRHLDFGTLCLGEKIKPLKKYGVNKTYQLIESEKMEYLSDGIYTTFEGKIEDIEKIFGLNNRTY